MEKTKLPLPLVHSERLWRWAKTAFFIVAMLASLLLVCAPPLLVVLLDLLLPPAALQFPLRSGGSPAGVQVCRRRLQHRLPLLRPHQHVSAASARASQRGERAVPLRRGVLPSVLLVLEAPAARPLQHPLRRLRLQL